MSTVINATVKLDKTSAVSGDIVTVTFPGATATSTVAGTAQIAATFTADDGTTTTLTGSLPTSKVTHEAVKLTALTIDGVAGVIAADGQSGTVTVP